MGESAARLEVVAGNAAGTSILVEDELVIGRQSEGAGRLADDEEISRQHARVSVDAAGSCAVEDLGSTNGTFVNGLRISSPQILAEGDTIELGATTLLVRELPGKAPPVEPEPGSTRLQPTVVPRARRQEAEAGPELATEAPAAEPAQAAVPEPPPPAPDAPEPGIQSQVPPPLSLRLTVDFAQAEAEIVLDDGPESVRLAFDGGAWRRVPTSPTPED
jgi:pSer/pThr/pTyr-binding forkhead associated (FHA) protein